VGSVRLVLYGAHCSGGVKKALDRAAELQADALQLFVQSPRMWRFPDHDPKVLEAFRDRRRELGIGAVLVHGLYLVNLASPNDEFYEKSLSTMSSTMDAACAIGADGVIFHVGSHLGAGFEAGLDRAVPALKEILDHCSDTTWLLMENSAGAGGTIGRSLDELAALFDACGRHERLGVCLDSCHLWVSGYDVTDRAVLDALLSDLDQRIGLDRLRALHVNDADAALGSNRDRHANLLEGEMGEGLGVFLANRALQELPAVMEIPGPDGHGPDAGDMKKLRELHARGLPARGVSGPARRRGRSGGRAGARRTPG
jgi:deoxyribonuclease-4